MHSRAVNFTEKSAGAATRQVIKNKFKSFKQFKSFKSFKNTEATSEPQFKLVEPSRPSRVGPGYVPDGIKGTRTFS
jgi:hypothetical protein